MNDTTGWAIEDVGPDEVAAFVALVSRNFLGRRKVTAESVAWRQRQFAGHRVRAARDGGRLVGTFRSFDVALPVPGALAPAEAVSSVTVAGTHRRRGVLTAMMSDYLEGARERGDAVLATLIASEGPIYGRFGYGPASDLCRWELDAAAARFRTDPARDGEIGLELATEPDLIDIAPAIYEQASLGLPGALPRTEHWWRSALGLEKVPGDDEDAARPAVIARDSRGEPAGVLSYRVEEKWHGMHPDSVARVEELTATTPSAYAALWRFLAEIDLVRTVVAADRPVHEPLPWLLADRRAVASLDRDDFHWIRLLDVPAALRARRYAAPGRVVLEVHDPRWPLKERLHLASGADGVAEVGETGAGADIALDVAALGAVYLGQRSLAELAVAGLVQEVTPGALRRLDAMLTWHPTGLVGHTWF